MKKIKKASKVKKLISPNPTNPNLGWVQFFSQLRLERFPGLRLGQRTTSFREFTGNSQNHNKFQFVGSFSSMSYKKKNHSGLNSKYSLENVREINISFTNT